MATENFNQYFPGYEILSELGKSNARVLKARNKNTGELVAIKHFSFNADADTIRRFQQESAIMTDLNHKNIVKLKEVHFDADLPYIVMELIEGGDLDSLLKKQKTLDVPTIIRLGLQIADALKEIHAKGVIHRDIKPANIMYRKLQNDELHFLLTDFGIAKLREQPSTVTGQSPMTYEYASPEQFHDLENLSGATDFYSLGVVLYQCLSGQVPFPLGSKGIGALSKSIETLAPPPLNIEGFFPKSLKTVINGLLEKQATKRINNPQTLKRLLKNADIEWDEYDGSDTGKTEVFIFDDISSKDDTPHTERYIPPKDKITPPPPKPNQQTVINDDKNEKKNKDLLLFLGIAIVIIIAGFTIISLVPDKNSEYADSTAVDSTMMAAADTTATPIDTVATVDYYALADQYYKEKNYAQALEYFKYAADQSSDGYAENYVGYMYDIGEGVSKDYLEAKNWFEKGAIKGNSIAEYNLGVFYDYGRSIDNNVIIAQDMTKALRYYKRSAEQGYQSAIDRLKELGYDYSQYSKK